MISSSNIVSDPFDRQFFYCVEGYTEQEVILTLGAGSYIGNVEINTFVDNQNFPHILAGRFCSLADKIYFAIGGNHNYKNVSTFPFDVNRIVQKIFASNNSLPYERPNRYQIIIGHDVWIGYGAMIMGGVKIGNGAVIGANAVVAKDIPPYAIAVGNPARVVKYRFDEKTIKKLLAVKWWNWDLEKIAANLPLMNDIEKFLETHYSPELEEFPDDELAQKLNNFAVGGQAIYQLIADFEAKSRPLWPKVIKDFKQANLTDAVLVIWLGKDATEENSQALTATIGDKKNIITFKHEENFSPSALRKATHFITTREMSTLAAFDYLWNTDVKIISALDDNIFGG